MMSASKRWRPRTSVSAPVLTLVISILVISVTLFITYNCIFFSDRTNLAGRYDVYRAAGPIAYYADYVVHHGEIPLWNPLTYCGMPCAANPIASFFYPPNLVRSCLTFNPTPFKTQVGWIVLMGLHLLLAGTGIVFLAREHRLSYAASFAAAFVFIFSAVWVRRVCEYHFITMVGWLPILLLITRRALSQPSLRHKLCLALVGGLVLGVSLLSGSINIAPYMGVSIVGYAFLFRLLHLRPETAGKRDGLLGTVGGDGVFLATLLCLGGLVAAALLWPGAELGGFTSRSNESIYSLTTPGYRSSAGDLYKTLIRYPGLKWEPENIRGAGIVALLLALAGLTYPRGRAVGIYVGLFLMLFDCSLGRPFPMATLVERLSPIQMVSSTRAFDFALLPLGMLAGFGLDAVTTRSSSRWLRAIRCVILVAVGIVALRSLSDLIGPDAFIAVSKLALAVPAAALVVLLLASWSPGQWLWRALLVALLFGETFVWNYHYVPWLLMRPNFPKWAGVYHGGESFWSDNQRGTDKVVNRHLYALRPAVNGYEPAHIDRVRQVIASDRRARVYHRLVSAEEATQDNHRGNLFLKRSFWLARQYVKGPLPPKDSTFPATTTVFLPEAADLPVPRIELSTLSRRCVSEEAEDVRTISPEQLAFMQSRLKSGGTKRSVTLPTVTAPGVHSALCLKFRSTSGVVVETRFSDPTTGHWELGHTARIAGFRARDANLEIPLPDFERLQAQVTVELHSPRDRFDLEQVYLLADHADEGRLIKILSRGANSVDLEVGELEDFRVLTFLDAAYPGWRAYVDSEQVPVYLANDAFKAIVVPPGTHRIRFAFSPWRPYMAMLISLMSVLGAGTGIVLLRPRPSPTVP